MKKLIILFASLVVVMRDWQNPQNIVKHGASLVLDSLRTGIAHGKIDSISYPSKTVGKVAKPHIIRLRITQKTGNILFYIFYMALRDEKENA